MRKQQTAVEWLSKRLMLDNKAPNYNEWAIKKAKQMEIEQIERAYIYGCAYGIDTDKEITPMNYYNETFKSEK
jgi:hypothetical protein